MAWPRRRHLRKYLPVFESGDDVFDAGPDPAVRPVVVMADDPAGVIATRRSDRRDAAVAAVTEDLLPAVEEVRDGCAGDDDVVAVTGPALAGEDHAAPVSADDDQGAVDDPPCRRSGAGRGSDGEWQ